MKYYAHPQNDHTVINQDGYMFTIGLNGLENKRVFWGSLVGLNEIPEYQTNMLGW